MEFEILDHETLPSRGEHSAFSQLDRKRAARQMTPEGRPSRNRGVQIAGEHPVAPY